MVKCVLWRTFISTIFLPEMDMLAFKVIKVAILPKQEVRHKKTGGIGVVSRNCEPGH